MYSFKYKTVYFINDVGAKIRKANNNDNKNLILLTSNLKVIIGTLRRPFSVCTIVY